MEESNTCERCGNEPQKLHTCPYAADVGGDHETLCNCCFDCEDQCCQDI